MATLTVRRIDDEDYRNLSRLARENGRSISAEVRGLIAEAASRKRADALVAEIDAFRKRNPLKLPSGQDVLSLLREERDSW